MLHLNFRLKNKIHCTIVRSLLSRYIYKTPFLVSTCNGSILLYSCAHIISQQFFQWSHIICWNKCNIYILNIFICKRRYKDLGIEYEAWRLFCIVYFNRFRNIFLSVWYLSVNKYYWTFENNLLCRKKSFPPIVMNVLVHMTYYRQPNGSHYVFACKRWLQRTIL